MLELTTRNFNLAETMYSGQVFRYEQLNEKFYYIVEDECIECYQEDSTLIIENTEKSEAYRKHRFNLSYDTCKAEDYISHRDPILAKIIPEHRGLTILN